MLHPILSIISIPNSNYNRKMRILDIFIKIHITFLFSLLPVYAGNNSVSETAMNARNINIRGIDLSNLQASIQQVNNNFYIYRF